MLRGVLVTATGQWRVAPNRHGAPASLQVASRFRHLAARQAPAQSNVLEGPASMRTPHRRFRLTAVGAATGLAVAQTTPLPAAAQGPPPPPPGVQDQQSGGDPPAR